MNQSTATLWAGRALTAIGLVPLFVAATMKLIADAELHFGGESPLAGLKLIGFSAPRRR